MIEQMAIAIALLGFNDLGRSVARSFIFRSRFTPVFLHSGITNSSSFNGKIFRKKSTLEDFRGNVLKKTSLA